MSKYIRRKNPGGYYFFTVVAFDRRPIFASETARVCLRGAIEKVAVNRPFDTIAMVLMPDHLHCIWKLPDYDKNYSVRWGAIKATFSRSWLKNGATESIRNVSRRKREERAVWQRRFWEHRIRNYDDLNNHINYIHYNPVKHGKVVYPFDWPWSTYKKMPGNNTNYTFSMDTINWINDNYDRIE